MSATRKISSTTPIIPKLMISVQNTWGMSANTSSAYPTFNVIMEIIPESNPVSTLYEQTPGTKNPSR